MREALKNAVHNAILLEYKLPHKVSGLDLDKSCLSSQNDICFSNSNPQEISKLFIMASWNLRSTNMKLITRL